jgi:hypothetical protein
MKRIFLLLALVGVILLNAGPIMADDGFYVIVAGGGVGTKITSLPYTIKSPGFYYVTGDFNYLSGNGITVESDNVTLDLMGFRLRGGLSWSGIYMFGRQNVEIRNGTLSGWGTAINEGDADNGRNHRVFNVRVQNGNYGIDLYGYGHMVKGCTGINNTGTVIGIYGGMASGNVVTGGAYGIDVSMGTISGNVVRDCTLYGITISWGTVSNNMVFNCNTGIYVNSGNVIGNSVLCNTNQTGISLSAFPIMMDQNTVGGDGTRYAGGNGNVVWAGKSTYNPWGNNAGHP